MPTNLLRKADTESPTVVAATSDRATRGTRIAVLTAGKVRLRLALADTATSDRIWQALPLHATAQTWGESIHFEIPVESGRDRTARINGAVGEIYFWTEDDRVLIPFGPTAISRSGECRLPSPANVWALALDDVRVLAAVRPGVKVSLVAEPARVTPA